MKKRINEHDMTKDMMEIMRGGFKGLLNEFDNAQSLDMSTSTNVPNAGDDAPEPQGNQGDTLDVKPGDSIYNEESKKMKDIVDSSAEISNFKIYTVDKDVLIEGVIAKRQSEDSGIHFKMSLRAGKIETSMKDIDLTDDVNEILKRLNGYYEIWSKEWNEKINEYKPSQG